MSLSSIYQSFLATPSPDALAKDATLNYITTLMTFSDSAPIVKHLGEQQKALKKNKEKVLNAIESSDALYLEVETTLEFLTGGGAYLPNLDDNFLADHVVTLPIVCPDTHLLFRHGTHWFDSFTLYILTRLGRFSRFAFIGTKAPCSSR